MNSRLVDIFGEVEDYHWWFEGRRKLLGQILDAELGGEKQVRILDVGCGTGGSFRFLGKYGAVEGIDKSPLAISWCKRKGMKQARVADAAETKAAANRYGVVTMLDVIEHMPKPEKALREAKRILVSGGVVVITVPACQAIWAKHDEMQGHQKRYSVEDLKVLARKSGLQWVEGGYFNVVLMPIVAAVRWLSGWSAFAHLGEYDSRINFEIAKVGVANRILKLVFETEISLGRYIRYPIGVSAWGVLRKP